MECYCEPSSGEICQVWIETWHKARKPHRCCECGESIGIGDRYQRTFSVFEGVVNIYKTCEFCAKEWPRVFAALKLDVMMPGELACALVCEMRQLGEMMEAR